MGIINCTPDSFYDGSTDNIFENLCKKVTLQIETGADIIDVGGQSTRPNATQISADEELNRVIPIIHWIHKNYPTTLLSVDTFYSKVATQAIQAGAHIVNDVSGGNMDSNMITTVAKLGVPYIMMHMQGTPTTMQINPTYNNVLVDVYNYLQQKIALAITAGIKEIIIDPGFGFGKTIEQNYTLLKNLNHFTTLQLPILVGLSRKSMATKLLQIAAANALNASTALHMVALQNGANILRVHDVAAAKEAITIYNFLQKQPYA